MRAACWFIGAVSGVICCVLSCPGVLAREPAPEPYFAKYGGEVRTEDNVLGKRAALAKPLKVLESRDDALRVGVNGASGWIPKNQVGTLAEVLKDTSQRIAERPQDIELRLFRAQLMAQRSASEDRELALADLHQVVQIAPKDPRGYLARGGLWAKLGQFDAAIDDFTTGLELDPKLAPALLERGLAYYAVREFDAALADASAYLAVEPEAAMGYAARAMAHVELGRFEQAEKDFTAALKRDDQSALPWFERARMWMRRHDAAKAVADLTQTLKRDPKHLDATIFLATLLACGPDNTPRDGKRAVELARSAKELAAANDPRPLEALAAAYAETGDFNQAIKVQESALALLPKAGVPEAAQGASRYRLAQYKARQPVRLMR